MGPNVDCAAVIVAAFMDGSLVVCSFVVGPAVGCAIVVVVVSVVGLFVVCLCVVVPAVDCADVAVGPFDVCSEQILGIVIGSHKGRQLDRNCYYSSKPALLII